MALVLVPRLKQPAAALVRPIQGWGKPGGGLLEIPGGGGGAGKVIHQSLRGIV